MAYKDPFASLLAPNNMSVAPPASSQNMSMASPFINPWNATLPKPSAAPNTSVAPAVSQPLKVQQPAVVKPPVATAPKTVVSNQVPTIVAPKASAAPVVTQTQPVVQPPVAHTVQPTQNTETTQPKTDTSEVGKIKVDPNTGVQYYDTGNGTILTRDGNVYDPGSGSFISRDEYGNPIYTPVGQGGKPLPQYTPPDTSAPDATIQKGAQAFDPAAIQADLDRQLAAISAKYEVQRNQAAVDAENQRKSTLSDLYSVGVVNPVSSGTGSVNSASSESLNRILSSINANEGMEKSQALIEAYTRKFNAGKETIAAGQQQRENITDTAQKNYENAQKYFNDSWTQLQNTINSMKAGQELSTAQKSQAQNTINAMLTQFGSMAFSGADSKQIAQLEKAAGYPSGSISKGLALIKQKEFIGTLNLHTLDDGSLINLRMNPDTGLPESETVAKPFGVGKMQADRLQAITKDYSENESVKDFRTVQAALGQAQNAAQYKDGPHDLQLIYNVARVMNPGIGVRGNEYDNVVSAQGLLNDIGIKVTKGWLNGDKLSDQAREEFLQIAESAYAQKESDYKQVYNSAAKQLQNFNLDPNEYLSDFTQTSTSQNTQSYGKSRNTGASGNSSDPLGIL